MGVKNETKERIVHVANILVSEGLDNPTNDQVRERLGKGSLSHISPVMREWRESRKSASIEIPVELKKSIEASLSVIWSTASRLASTSVLNVKREASDLIDVITQERDEAFIEISRLESKLSEQENNFNLAKQELNKITTEMEDERLNNGKLSIENSAISIRLDDRNSQILNLKKDLEESRVDNKKLQAELIEIARKTI